MKLISNRRAWRRFLLNDLSMPRRDADAEREPKEYPCYAYHVVRSFGFEELAPMYLYSSDINRMVEALRRSTAKQEGNQP